MKIAAKQNDQQHTEARRVWQLAEGRRAIAHREFAKSLACPETESSLYDAIRAVLMVSVDGADRDYLIAVASHIRRIAEASPIDDEGILVTVPEQDDCMSVPLALQSHLIH